jgi:hypothetical protein
MIEFVLRSYTDILLLAAIAGTALFIRHRADKHGITDDFEE